MTRRSVIPAIVLGFMLSSSACSVAYHYGPSRDDPALTQPCYYARCERQQFHYGTLLFRSPAPDSARSQFATLKIIHFDGLTAGTTAPFQSTLEFESFDRSVVFDPSSVRLEHFDSAGVRLIPQSIEVDTVGWRAESDRFRVRIQVRVTYQFTVQSHISERVSAVINVRGTSTLVAAHFSTMRPVRTRPFWQGLLSV